MQRGRRANPESGSRWFRPGRAIFALIALFAFEGFATADDPPSLNGAWVRKGGTDIDIVQDPETHAVTLRFEDHIPGYYRTYEGKVEQGLATVQSTPKYEFELNSAVPEEVRARIVKQGLVTFGAILSRVGDQLKVVWDDAYITWKRKSPDEEWTIEVRKITPPKEEILTRRPEYCPIKGSLALAQKARAELDRIAHHYRSSKDLMWAFPYVYARVTQRVIELGERSKAADAPPKRFKNPEVLYDWIVNFYEFYALNLQRWIEDGKAEAPWLKAFLLSQTFDDALRRDPNLFGPLSMQSFMIGMYAHIRSDLPRALAGTLVKFHEGKFDRSSRRGDFDLLNSAIFTGVMTEDLPKVDIVPNVVGVLPRGVSSRVMDQFYYDTGVGTFRTEAFDRAEHLASKDPDFKRIMASCKEDKKDITVVMLPAKNRKPTEEELEEGLHRLGLIRPPQERIVLPAKGENAIDLRDLPVKIGDRYPAAITLLQAQWNPTEKKIRITLAVEGSGSSDAEIEVMLHVVQSSTDFRRKIRITVPGCWPWQRTRSNRTEAVWDYDGDPIEFLRVGFAERQR